MKVKSPSPTGIKTGKDGLARFPLKISVTLADGLIVEQRRESRLEPNQIATVKILGLTRGPVLEASILDISGSGMRILSKFPIPCGALVEIEANQTVSRGTVCRCNEQGLLYEVGIQVSESAPAPLVL